MRGSTDWIQTYTGRQFWPLEPRAEDVCLEDIAHALSNMCRFTGHCKEFYSVAQHAVLVSYEVESRMLTRLKREMKLTSDEAQRRGARMLALWGLHHDDSEAYICDVSRPLKRTPNFGELYKLHEAKLMAVICEHFGLPPNEPPIVKECDTVLLLTEQRDLMGRQAKPWKDQAEPLPEKINGWHPATAKAHFLLRHQELTQGKN